MALNIRVLFVSLLVVMIAATQQDDTDNLLSYNFWSEDDTPKPPEDSNSASWWLTKVLQQLPGILLELAKPKVQEWLDSEEGGEELVTSLKQMVFVGDRLVQFLQDKLKAREPASTSDVMQYGLQQLRLATGSNDNSAENSSAALQHGVETLKNLRDLLEQGQKLQNREGMGYGHGVYHHGWSPAPAHNTHMGNGLLDPFVLLAALSFGVFLFQLVYHFLNRSARSLDVVDLHLPLALSDVPEALNFLIPGEGRQDDFSEETDERQPRSLDSLGLVDDDVNPTGSFLATILATFDGYYRIYKQVEQNPTCARSMLCRLAVDDAVDSGGGDLVQLFLLAAGHFSGDSGVGNFTDDIQGRRLGGEKFGCDVLVPHCTSNI